MQGIGHTARIALIVLLSTSACSRNQNPSPTNGSGSKFSLSSFLGSAQKSATAGDAGNGETQEISITRPLVDSTGAKFGLSVQKISSGSSAMVTNGGDSFAMQGVPPLTRTTHADAGTDADANGVIVELT